MRIGLLSAAIALLLPATAQSDSMSKDEVGALFQKCVIHTTASYFQTKQFCFPDQPITPLAPAEYNLEITKNGKTIGEALHKLGARNSACHRKWAESVLAGPPHFGVSLGWAHSIVMSKKFKHPKILLNAAPGDHFGPGAVIVLPDYGDGECSDQAQRKMALDLIQMNRVWGQMQADANLSEQFKKMLGDLDNVYQLLRTQEGCPAFGLFARGFAPPPVTAAPRKIALRETNSVPPGTTLGWGSPSEVHASLLSLRARQDALKRSLAAKGIDAPGAGEDRETITIHGVKYSYDDLDPVKAAIKKSMANGEFLTQDQVRKAIEDKTAELGLDSETFTEVMKSVNNVRSEKLLSYQDTHPAPPGQQWTIDMDGKMQLIPTVSLGTMAPYDNSGAGSSSVNKAPEGVGYTPDQGSPPPAGVWNSAPPDSEGAPPAPIGVGSGPSNPQPVTPPSGSCVPGQKVTIKGVTFICGLPYGVPPAKQKKK